MWPPSHSPLNYRRKKWREKRKIKANTKFSFFGENFCDSFFSNRQKIESFALIAFFSHLLYARDLAKKSFPALISIK